MGQLIPFCRRRSSSLPPEWAPYLRRRWPTLAQLRLMLWAGLLLGLVTLQATRFWPASSATFEWASAEPAPPADDLPDPYAESRRSRAILDAQAGAPPPKQVAAPPELARIADAPGVIDGDTFIHGGATIRIADIDAPELHGRCPHEARLAARATRRLDELIGAGGYALHAAPDGRDADGYGRKLRIVTRSGRSIGDMLVAEGLARRWAGRREPWCT